MTNLRAASTSDLRGGVTQLTRVTNLVHIPRASLGTGTRFCFLDSFAFRRRSLHSEREADTVGCRLGSRDCATCDGGL